MNIFILQLRLKIAELMLQILRLQDKRSSEDKRLVLYATAKSLLGKDVAPKENEFGCAEAINFVFKKAFGQEVGGDLSTYRMYLILQKDKRFQKILQPLTGSIVISPTGFGNGNLKNGHVGLVSENRKIMSNDSKSGLWLENYTLDSWRERYMVRGGFPMVFFVPV